MPVAASGPGGGGNHVVGQRHPAPEGEGEGHIPSALDPGDRTGERVHDDVTAVAEHGDRDQRADRAHGPLLTALAEGPQEGAGQRVSGPGHLQDFSDRDTETYHDADAAEGRTEAGGDRVDDAGQRLPGDNTCDKAGDEERNEGVKPGPEDQDDDRRDTGHEGEEQLYVHDDLSCVRGRAAMPGADECDSHGCVFQAINCAVCAVLACR